MKTDQLIKLFADNLEALKQTLDQKSAVGIQKRTGMARATAITVLAGKNAATLDTIAKTSEGFKLPPWALLHPQGIELYKDKRLIGLIDHYAKSSEEGRAAICRNAATEAHYSKG